MTAVDRDDLQLRADPADRSDLARRPRRWPAASAVILLLAAAGAAGWWWMHRAEPAAPPVPSSAVQPVQPAAPVAEPTGPKYPLPALAGDEPVPASGIADALAELVGRKAVDAFLVTQDFPRRFVATVDNLGRDHAPIAAWPVQPTPGRFAVEERADGATISRTNAARYEPLVLLASSLDTARTVRLYRRMYPLLQQSYRDLGFGDRPFNDRVVDVIDLLLATPEPAQPPAVKLTEVKGPIPSERPWTRYEYLDSKLERLSAGQKMLVRVGLANERRLKDKLRQLRQELVQPAAAGTAAARP